MSIATLSSFRTKYATPGQRIAQQYASFTTSAGRKYSCWIAAGGGTPVSAAQLTSFSSGALNQQDGSTTLRLAELIIANAQATNLLGMSYWLCDRLGHTGGLSGTVVGAQTNNLPTAALSRYTSGVGVMAALEQYTAVGSTQTTATVSYTNSAGTAGQTAQLLFGGAAASTARRMSIIPWASGDRGVQAVASVSLAATTGTAGNFGVTTFKPLMMFPMGGTVPSRHRFNALLNLLASFDPIQSQACLFGILIGSSTSSGITSIEHTFIED